jgi:hypothetical protein
MCANETKMTHQVSYPTLKVGIVTRFCYYKLVNLFEEIDVVQIHTAYEDMKTTACG